MNHSSNEVKQLVSRACNYLSRCTDYLSVPELVKATLPMLVNGTKEKNSYVKADSELALVAVLRLRQGDDVQVVSSIIADSATLALIEKFTIMSCERFQWRIMACSVV